MSASEKLQALERRPAYIVRDEMERILPQIVAVVEKGQRVYAHVEKDFPEGVAVDRVFREFRAALTALEEALS